MTPFEERCQCITEQSTNCCELPSPPPAAPIPIENQPGQSAIRYRIGNFTSFRQAMLNQLAESVQGKVVPSVNTRLAPDGDYQLMFVELWAYLADVLTFYQERIANEAFLQTATQRDTLLRLCRLIDYRPNAGAGANALLAFTIEKNKSVHIPAGFRAGNKPVQGKEPAVFETESAFTAIGLHSAIPISAIAPTNQFAALNDFRELLMQSFTESPTGPTRTALSNIYSTMGPLFSQSFEISPVLTNLVEKEKSPREKNILGELENQSPSTSFESRFVLSEKTRPIVLQGTKTQLSAGDYVLIVPKNAKEELRQLDSVRVDKATNTTTIFWTETVATFSYERDAELFAFRVVASPFGSSAPAFDALSPTLTNIEGAPFKDKNWDDANKPDSKIPKDTHLYLDQTYVGATGSASQKGKVVLIAPGLDPKVLLVKGVRQETKSQFTIVAKVTVLSLEEEIPEKSYPIRSTVILTGAERLTLQNNLPLPRMMGGETLILAGQYPRLQIGQKVVVRGKRIDPITLEMDETAGSEEAELDKAPVVDETNNLTTVVLKSALQANYVRAETVLLANVVSATQGETIKDEVLGNGNGSAFQLFSLKKKPLTFLPSTNSEVLSAVESTLRVTVNGERWTERTTLFDSPADANAYTTLQDEVGRTTVIFGDGISGAKPPTGRDNIRARYRQGMGVDGNVSGLGIAQLLDNIPGIQKVVNPLPALGGLDPERIDQIRTNAPASLRTFGKAVSVRDYADLALNFPGVAKASAAWVDFDPNTKKAIAHPYIRLTVAMAGHAKLAEQPSFAKRLREFLDRRRDPNVPLRVTDGTEVLIDVKVNIAVDDRFPRQATLDRVREMLSSIANPNGPPGYFSFDRLHFGQNIALSDLYRSIQAVKGVRYAVIEKLQRRHSGSTIVESADILVGPTELVVIQNDPADPTKESLTVTHLEGGFVDT